MRTTSLLSTYAKNKKKRQIRVPLHRVTRSSKFKQVSFSLTLPSLNGQVMRPGEDALSTCSWSSSGGTSITSVLATVRRLRRETALEGRQGDAECDVSQRKTGKMMFN